MDSDGASSTQEDKITLELSREQALLARVVLYDSVDRQADARNRLALLAVCERIREKLAQ